MADIGSTICYAYLDYSPEALQRFLRDADRAMEMTSMAYDASDPKTFELFGLNDAQLRRKGLTPEQIQDLRKVQHSAAPARTAEEIKEATKPVRRATRSESSGE